MTRAEELDLPWLGARPFEERHRKYFFGRRREADDIIRRVTDDRLTILTGESGCGKTSLLYGAVVPGLRLLRERDFAQKAPRPMPPVLVLREWTGGGAGFAEAFHQALDKALAYFHASDIGPPEIRAALPKKAPAMNEGDLPVHVLEDLAAGAGGLVIVLDQFEEILRHDRTARASALDLIRHLIESELRIRVLVSMREEAILKLREIETTVRPYYLLRMTRSAATYSITAGAAAHDAKFTFEEGAITKILGWLEAVERERASPLLKGPVGPTDRRDDAEPVNTLLLMTVLQDIWFNALRDTGVRHITNELLDKYAGDRTEEVVPRSVERYIMRALDPEPEDQPIEDGGFTDVHEMQALVVRIAARIAPHLHAHTYKIPRQRGELEWLALKDDLEELGIERNGFLAARRAGERITVSASVKKDLGVRLSGPGRRWHDRTPERLLQVLDKALGRLHRGAVVKEILVNKDETVVELVHDGLGEPFVRVAEKFRREWRDVAASPVVNRGASIRVGTIARSASEARIWQGVLFSGGGFLAAGPGAEITGVAFEDCDFAGVIFKGIKFTNVTFQDCNLDGAIFIKCIFHTSDREHGPMFRRTGSNAVFFHDCAFHDVVFDEVWLNQCQFNHVQLPGDLTIVNSSVRSCQFYEIGGDDAKGRLRVREPRPGAAMNLCDARSSASIDAPKDLIVRSTAMLPPSFGPT